MSIGLMIVVGLVFVVVGAEHICVAQRCERRPSTELNRLANHAVNMWYWLGQYFARWCSWIVWLQLDQLLATVAALLRPLWTLAVSPLWFFRGYRRRVLDVYRNHQWSVHVGAAILVAAAAWMFGPFVLDSILPWITHSVDEMATKQIKYV